MSVANRITAIPVQPLNAHQRAVRWVCEHAKGSILELCELYGFGPSQLHTYYSGRRTPFASTVKRLCRAAGFEYGFVMNQVKGSVQRAV